ncbi:xanthosine permease [Anaeromyces robustus]|uniref:Xanthosine permease n=1 Tax=Anaeromyces robustus TaxID=1754192 RepID=A0A1Y1XCW7_9FUNG|nr:xanthosine permease [Anaeromyces robustus]|eukprot:ORX83573.1 xanthosine permease [Anaeromyces robustus]
MKLVKTRLIIMNYLIFSVWGAYLCSIGIYLFKVGMVDHIGSFFAVQGIVSLFMPALMGIIADRWVPAQKLLSICQILSAIFMGLAGYMGMKNGDKVTFSQIFPYYFISVGFYMPSLSLGNSVSYHCLTEAGLDTVKSFPPIRVFGTVGFIISMWIVDLTGAKNNYIQLYISAGLSVVLAIYALTLPNCRVNKKDGEEKKKTSFVEAFGLRAFTLFKQRNMCIFFIFSFLLGMCLQITNGFCSTYLEQFGNSPVYKDTFAVRNSVILTSISQISETLCILLIPFFLKRFGIKKVMTIAFAAWGIRFIFLGLGYPTGFGLVLLVASMIVYGVAFDFYNISGSLFVEESTEEDIRSSAQGVFMMMTNGFGATIGSWSAQAIVNAFTKGKEANFDEYMKGWSNSWYVFGSFAIVVGILFVCLFRYQHNPQKEDEKTKKIEI